MEHTHKNHSKNLRRIIDETLAGILVFKSIRNRSGKIIDFEYLLVNKFAAKILKKEESELIGCTLLEVFPSHTESGLFQEYVAVVENEELLDQEIYYPHEGVEAWYRIRANRLDDGFVVNFLDITPQKKQELKLAGKELVHSKLVKLLNLGTWEWDLSSQEMSWTDEVFRLFEYEPQEIKPSYQHFIKHIHPEEVEDILEKFRDIIPSKKKFDIETRIITKNGNIRYVHSKGKFLIQGGRSTNRIIGTLLDITEQKNYLEKIKKNERLYEVLTKNIPNLTVLLYDSQLRLIIQEGQELPFFKPMSLPLEPQYLPALILESLREEFTEQLQEVLKGQKLSFYRHIASNHYEITMIPLEDEKKEFIAGMILYRNINHYKNIEEELHSKLIELKSTNENLEQFAYVASHDLQEPLRKIQAFGDLLFTKQMNRLDDTGKDYLSRMQKAARRMQALINDLLSFSRVARQKGDLLELDPNQLILDILGDLETLIHEKKATIQAQDLPLIRANPLQLRQLFQNLLSNALKFTHPDIKPEIQVKGKILTPNQIEQWGKLNPLLTYTEITFSDNGIGFDQNYSEKIFHIFQRLHNRVDYEGTGIGLAICQKVVENHQGHLYAESAPGKGAIFYVILPVNSES